VVVLVVGVPTTVRVRVLVDGTVKMSVPMRVLVNRDDVRRMGQVLVAALMTDVDRVNRLCLEIELPLEQFVAILRRGVIGRRLFRQRLLFGRRPQLKDGVNLLVRSAHSKRFGESEELPPRPNFTGFVEMRGLRSTHRQNTIPKGDFLMRFAVLVKANKDSEAGVLPSPEMLGEMGKFNEQLAKDGVMLAGDGLKPTSEGARLRFDGGRTTVTDGPFTETKELVAGFWIVQGKSKEEIVERFLHAPFDGGAVLEIRPIYEVEDFAENATPEIRQRAARTWEMIK
jgi:hypothetical protein